jgi:hypothetical protein
MGQFYYAAKAFDILERLDSDHEYEDALRGAIVGTISQLCQVSFRWLLLRKQPPIN